MYKYTQYARKYALLFKKLFKYLNIFSFLLLTFAFFGIIIANAK